MRTESTSGAARNAGSTRCMSLTTALPPTPASSSENSADLWANPPHTNRAL